ncbi:type II secretion system GspH family protein [Mesorhizobium sp. C416B]|uniref:PulJ/GspJ family protein n=1 Tax=unclassified Mesorhizobium TaxID=325217 RepID=UPI0003CEAA8D|nr:MULTISPECIES: type II secretion system protein [unclassified Mesorhizobium]ESX11822.1 general secretion pathway protein I [Mesorhizobium sp. LSJC265A00]ESY05059.1 general secretion pathway protein I [Mesorhizobium sp. LNJC399B00]ESW89439.1 general secretion pathway protein I [Mesorhizobium sp. LSJC269B00]ESX46047.1 general secretion pathway protein I [Mesorhizobium sp. LSHC426A00]ESX54913.1 general secretion pathway protein I [Mesorhizobium sp. LSHC424B00]
MAGIAVTEPSSEDGFSILEMIVAMTILALVLGIASQSIVLASRSIAIAKAQIEAARAARIMLSEYEAGTDSRRSGWQLQTRPIVVSKTKMVAVVIGRSNGAGQPFLTFVPAKDRQ